MLSFRLWRPEGTLELDLVGLSAVATVADLFRPLQEAADDSSIPKSEHPKRLAACAGCRNNCCRRYAIMPDLLTVRKLAGHFGQTLREFSQSYLAFDADQPFATFRSRRCPFLQNELCGIYALRPAYCHFYLCTPQSERTEKLKAQVSLLGEIALRNALIEEGLGPSSWQELKGRNDHGEMLDWPGQNPFLWVNEYSELLLRDCCNQRLWEWLLLPAEQTRWQSYADWCRNWKP